MCINWLVYLLLFDKIAASNVRRISLWTSPKKKKTHIIQFDLHWFAFASRKLLQIECHFVQIGDTTTNLLHTSDSITLNVRYKLCTLVVLFVCVCVFCSIVFNRMIRFNFISWKVTISQAYIHSNLNIRFVEERRFIWVLIYLDFKSFLFSFGFSYSEFDIEHFAKAFTMWWWRVRK